MQNYPQMATVRPNVLKITQPETIKNTELISCPANIDCLKTE